MQSADFLSAVFFYLKEGENLNQNWIVENLNNAFSTWNGKLGELWGLVTTGPQTFKGGAVWSVMQTLHNGMVGIGYALVVLFFAISLCKNTMNFHELKRPEAAIHYFLRFVAAKALVGYGISSKQATVEAISRGVHYIAAKIKALLSQTVRHAAQSLLALLGAGGVVLLLAMVIGAAAAVIGSPMGILFADESGDPNSIPIAEIVADTNADFGAAVNDIVSAHPECSETTITYDYEDGHTWASYWPEVLAIFAVHTNLNSDSDVVVINAAQMQRIQDTFWAMHEITYEVEEVDTTPEPTEDDPDPEQQTDYILHITVSSKTVDELAELYNFTQDQKDILHQLLSEEMRPSLLALCGGIAVADGELCWPLPGHTYISCHFGEVDAFGNAGHRGTDIPAPEGTPILAAHSGTVLVSGWNDSYGNQVLLDNGAGLSTRYAHMTQTAVTAGEAVTAGQIIGYVGSTGDSTGNHLHFEVMQNGVRMNPLELVFAQ